MFGNKAKGLTIVYKYGCRAPSESDLKIALDEIFLRNRLWNNLVEIDRSFRNRRDPLVVSDLDRTITAIQEQLSDLEQRFKETKAVAAYKTVVLGQDVHALKDIVKRIGVLLKTYNLPEPAKKKQYRSIPNLWFDSLDSLCSHEEMRQAITALRQALKPLYAAAKEERKALFLKHKAEIDALNAERVAAVKQARQTSGLYWGNYNDVIASYDTAHSQAVKEWTNLSFRTYDSSGKLTVQFVTPLTPDLAFATNGQIQLEPVPESAWDRSLGRARKKQQWTTLKIRMRSGEKHTPIWLTMPVCIHRPLPAGATIQMASIIRKKVGFDWRYDLLLTLRLPEPAATKKKKTAVIRFCSRLEADRSLHIATIEAAGKTEKIVLSNDITKRFEKLDDLRSIQDQYQTAAQTVIREIRKDAPEWFAEATQHTHVWKRVEAYLALAKEWKNKRFSGDEQAFATLVQLQERYSHLYPWQANLRDKLLARRKDQYRNVAAALVKKFGSIQMEPLQETRPKRAEKESQELQNKRYWRRAAALYDLQTIIKNTARREGVRVDTLEDTVLTAVA